MNRAKNTNNRKKAVYREVVERYCHVIDKNTVIIKTVHCDDTVVSECMNNDKCRLYGGCRNAAVNASK